MKGFLIFLVILAVIVGGFFLLRDNYQAPLPQGVSTSTPTEQPASAEINKITAQNFAFSPAVVTVKMGTTVTWTNEDSAPHTVADKPNGDMFKSNTLNQGQSYSFTFNKAGEYDYFCTIHPNMTGKVIVMP